MSSGGSSLGGTAVRGGLAVAIGQVLRTVIQFVGLILLAHLLTPADFGLVAMVTSIIGVTSVLSDFGLSMAILREVKLGRQIRDSLFYINAFLALAVTLGMWVAAPSVAAFYGEPRLEEITRWIAVFAFVAGLAPQYRAELARGHRFGALASVDAVAQGLAIAVACIAAIRGAGYWAVVVQQATAATALVALLAILSRYMPRSRPTLRGIREHVSIGASTLGLQLTSYLGVNAAPIAVGRALGTAAVGLYTRAYQLVSFPLVQLAAPLTSVVVPILAHVADGPDLIAAAKRVQLVMAYALLPLLVLIIVGGGDLAEMLFGLSWRPSGYIAQVLAVGGIFQVFGYINYWLFIRMGRLGALWAFEGVVWIFATAAYFLLAAQGAVLVAALYSAGLFMNWLAVTTLGLRIIGLPTKEFLVPSLKRLVFLAPVLTTGVVIREVLVRAGWGAIWTLFAALGSSLLAVGIGSLIPSFGRELREFITILGNFRRREA